MKKLILFITLIVFSMSVAASYKIYSMPQVNGGGNVVDIPKPSCLSDPSTVADGMYVVCGAGSSEVPVANGEAFELTASKALEGYSCSDGYADDYQAIKLAAMLNKKVYTPFSSYLPVTGSSGNSVETRGRAYYVHPDGNDNATYMYPSAKYYSGSGCYNKKRSGTKDSLKSQLNNHDCRIGVYNSDDSSPISSLVANRACVIIPEDS